MQFIEFQLARGDTGETLKFGKVTVYLTGTTTPASLFNSSGGAISNPITADISGLVGFSAANGVYDYLIKSADGLYQLTVPKQQLYDLQGLSNALAAGTIAGLVSKIKDTKANLFADLASSASTLGLVYADPDPANNDVYIKLGASGSGSWQGPLGLFAPGAKGDPGANVMAIGTLALASGLFIPIGTDLVRTSGFTTPGVGGADYIADSLVDAAWLIAHPGAGFISANGRGFRLIGINHVINSGMFGAIDGTNPRRTGETVNNCSDAIEAAVAYQKWLARNRSMIITIDDRQFVGLGISRTLMLDETGFSEDSFYDTLVLPIYPGRLVAMANMDCMVWLRGKTFAVLSDWQCDGAVFDRFVQGYSYCYAKSLVRVQDAGGGKIGGVRGRGFRLWALDLPRTGEGSPTFYNNIPLDIGKIHVADAGCGWGPDGARFKGTYAGGSWVVASSDDYGQRHRVTLTAQAGIDVTDLELGASIKFDGKYVREVQNIVSHSGQDVVVDVYPILPTHSGSFESYHGGGVNADGANLANTTIDGIEVLGGGTCLLVGALFCPTIITLLAESCKIGVQLGKTTNGGREAKQGLNIGHYHIENCEIPILDVVTVCQDVMFGTRSALAGNARGVLDTSLTQHPALISGGVYAEAYRRCFNGIGFHFTGGWFYSRGDNVEYNQLGNTNVAVSNDPFMCDRAPRYGNNLDFTLNAEFSYAEKLNQRKITVGPFYGGGTGGSPGGNSTFRIVDFGAGNLSQKAVAATGSISGNVLTITGMTAGQMKKGDFISGSGIAAGTQIVGYGTGGGWIGTYLVNIAQTVASTAITAPGSTIHGSTADYVLSGFTGPVEFDCVLELNSDRGNAANWEIFPRVLKVI
jgi:hypothetical protein